MPRSKLEAYEDIINVLTEHALTIDDIGFNCSMDCVNLQERLAFLVKHDIVEIEVSRDNRAFYVLTCRGLTIAKTLAVTKRLEKLQTNRKNQPANYVQIAPAESEEDEEEATSTF
jgi:predicted transcriptional regulator